MEGVYRADENFVKPSSYYRIPLSVGQDRDISDGAKMLFAEIFGLSSAYKKCTASNAHFMDRRGKSCATIKRQLVELESRGYITITTTDSTNRTISVPSRFMGSKDQAPNDQDDAFFKNELPTKNEPGGGSKMSQGWLKNEHSRWLKNEPRKTPESESKINYKITDSKTQESSRGAGVIFNKIIQSEQEIIQSEEESAVTDIATTAHEFFIDHQEQGLVSEYLSILRNCAGREECWKIGLLSAREAHRNGTLRSPVALVRSVVAKHLAMSQHAVVEALEITTARFNRASDQAWEKNLAAQQSEQNSTVHSTAKKLEDKAKNKSLAPQGVGALLESMNSYVKYESPVDCERISASTRPDDCQDYYLSLEYETRAEIDAEALLRVPKEFRCAKRLESLLKPQRENIIAERLAAQKA